MRKKMLKKAIVVLLTIALLGTTLAGCSCAIGNDSSYADLVVYGTIYTAEDENYGLAEAFAVKDGKYIYVGDKEGAKKYIKEGKTEILDRTNEGLIIPGATEGHGHYFDGTGLNSQLPGCDCSYEEVLKILKEQVETQKIKQFVSFGWKTAELSEKKADGYNVAEEIEKVAPGIPVVLIDNSGHSAVCNTTALKNAGILDNPSVRGGEVGLDKEGKPSGFLGDQVVFYVVDKVIDKPLTDEQYKNACTYAVNTLLKLGYTNTLDAFTNMYHPDALYEAIKDMDDAGELTMNVAACYNIKSYDADKYKEKVDEVVDITKKCKSKHLNPGYIKLFVDGVVEGGTGWISREYTYAKEGKEHGNVVWNQDELNAIVSYANSKDILIHAHTYGDAACKSTIDAFVASNDANKNQFRNCLAHVRNIQTDDVIRAANNKIPIAENLIWHTGYDDRKEDERATKEFVVGNIGEDYYYSGYPMKSLMDNGVVVSSSTDAPAAMFVEGSIMNVLEVATTGILPGDDSEAFAPNELLTVREGLKALTINGAWQLGLEKERGSIKVGKYADFVVLDKNILNYQGEELRTIGNTKIVNTYFEGKKVYSAN